jgi:hypothetical protein
MPGTDLKRIERWCREQVPEHLSDQLRVKCEVGPSHVTIFETRPDWRGGPDWLEVPIARLRYAAGTGQWTIYWRDRNLRFHGYDRKLPSKNVQSLLDHIGSREDPIFFG